MDSNHAINTQTLLNQYLPKYQLRQVDRMRVRTPIEQAWPIVRGLDTYELPISRFLFNLRTWPEKLIKRLRGQKFETVQHSRIEDFTGPQKGFKVLGEIPGQEIVIGSIGKFWQLNIPFIHCGPKDFRDFSEPGWGKLAWNLRLDPDSQGGTWLTWELRVTATDEMSWKTFKKYWFVIGQFSHLLRRMALRDFQKKLGPVNEESLSLPGDSIITSPVYQKTMAIMIDRNGRDLWPWLVQMGCRRAGWYSIDRLDNAGVRSADQILPEFQNIRVGDVLPWKPEGQEGFTVISMDPNKHLILGSAPLNAKAEDLEFADTWAFILEPAGPEATRLITRVRALFKPSLKMKFMTLWLGLAHQIMQSAQLRNLKNRVEKMNPSFMQRNAYE